MTNGWQEVSLGSLLTRIKDEVLIQDFEKYQRLTIRTNNKGIEIRDELEGHLIGTKNQYVVHGGQFLLSKIDAMNGAFGIVPEHVENGIITSNFWAYDVDEEKLFSKYFNYLTHTRSFQEFCIQASSGTTHRKYLREDLFLGMEIPLPPLTEQLRVVAHIESLAARVNEAQRLREEADIQTNALLSSAMGKVFDFSKSNECLGDYVSIISGYGFPSDQYSEAGNYQILRIGNVRDGYLDLTRAPVYWNHDGDKRISKVELSENEIVISMTGTRNKRDYGYVALVPANAKLLLNQRLAKITPKIEVDIQYLFYFLRSPFFKDRLFPQSKGTANQANLSNQHIEVIPFGNLPPLDEQRRIVAYLDGLQAKVNAQRGLQSQSQEELDALLPSVLDRAFKGEL